MAGVNIKMGVSGVAQFKQAMKESQAAVKTLDAELKLNEQQFRLTGDAEKYLQDKSSLLEKQIKEQSNTVQQAQRALEQMEKNGVNKNSVAFQQMQQSMIRAKTDLVNMQTELQNVGTAGENAAEGVDSMNDELASIGRNISWQNVTDGIGEITKTLENGARAAWNLGKRIVQATLGAGAWADDLATEAQAWEITPEELYRMQETARIIDTDAETILQARQKMTQGLGKDSKEVLGAFADLVSNGLLPEDYDPRRRNAADVFWDAGEALMNLTDEYDRQVYAQALFGKSWRELVPLFSAGREEYEKTMEGWTWIGDDQMKSLTELNDAEQKLTSEWEAFQKQFEAALAPTMTTVMETLRGLLQEFNTYLQSPEGQAMMDKLGEAISGLFTDLASIDPDEVMNTLKGIIESITGAFQWLIDNREGVVEAVKFIIAGWAGLKLAGGALEIMKFIEGMRNLSGGGGGKGGTPTGQPTAQPTGQPAAEPTTQSTGGGGRGNFWTRATDGIKSLFGAGSAWSMMGGAATFAPIAAMIAGGYVGARMIGANLNDENLNKVYGGNGGEGDVFDTMDPHQRELAFRYFKVWNDKSKTGSEEAMTAREELVEALEEGGYELSEQSVSLIENAFENWEKGETESGLAEKVDALVTEMETEEARHASENNLFTRSAEAFRTLFGNTAIEEILGSRRREINAGAGLYPEDELYDWWKLLKNQTELSGQTAAEAEAAQEFARQWMDFINDEDEPEDGPLMRLWELLDQGGALDEFNTAMGDMMDGEKHYGDLEEYIGPISTALDLIEQDMAQRNNETKVTPEDLAKLDLLPGAIGDAVKSGMASVTIVISGDAVDAMTPRISRNQAKSFFHEY